MSNDISVFPVALLENAVTRPIAYQGEEVCGHLSDEPRRCTFPMNCLYSTCRLTLIPDGWSTNRKLADYFRVARDSPKISGSAAEFPFPQWSRRFGCFSERVLQGLVTLVFTKCENKMPSNLCSSDEHGSGPSGVDWRVLTVRDSPYRKRRLAITWEKMRRLCVRPDRRRQGELKSGAPPGGTGGPQAAAMRLNDRPTDG
jgi:hypothetical protein